MKLAPVRSKPDTMHDGGMQSLLFPSLGKLNPTFYLKAGRTPRCCDSDEKRVLLEITSRLGTRVKSVDSDQNEFQRHSTFLHTARASHDCAHIPVSCLTNTMGCLTEPAWEVPPSAPCTTALLTISPSRSLQPHSAHSTSNYQLRHWPAIERGGITCAGERRKEVCTFEGSRSWRSSERAMNAGSCRCVSLNPFATAAKAQWRLFLIMLQCLVLLSSALRKFVPTAAAAQRGIMPLFA